MCPTIRKVCPLCTNYQKQVKILSEIKYKLVFCCSYELVPFTKLGWKNEERAWLFMLGAVTGGTVDLGLDNVVITPERYTDMFFTLPIVQSMYVKTFLTAIFFFLRKSSSCAKCTTTRKHYHLHNCLLPMFISM